MKRSDPRFCPRCRGRVPRAAARCPWCLGHGIKSEKSAPAVASTSVSASGRQWRCWRTASRARLQVTTVETCFQARGLALFGDRQAEARWASCRAYLERFQALFAFALSVRWGGSAPKILRGPRLSTDWRALKAYAKAARAECRALGEGVEFVSGSRMNIRELAAFAALFLARDGDVPFSAEVSRAAA